LSVAVLSPASARSESADESDLIRRAQAGDREAFGELYRQHHAKVALFLRSQLPKSGSDIEDAAADAFITALTRIDHFSLDESGRFVNWLVGIARHHALHYRRHRATHPEFELPEWGDTSPIDDRVLDPEQVVVDRIEVASLLARLTPPQREAIVLQYAAEVPAEEIARRRGTSFVALRKLTCRARRTLRAEQDTLAGAAPRRAA